METAVSGLSAFLEGVEFKDGLRWISRPRAYGHDEGDYDRQYALDSDPPELRLSEADALLTFLLKNGLNPAKPLLEIGCGTGRVSVGLAMRPELAHLLITDPSPAFCRITKRKMEASEVRAGQVDIAVLSAEDLGLIPDGAVSAILLRSVLHHILDVDGFLIMCAAVLPPGGILLCEEPYYEGYMMMGFLAQFIEPALAAAGYTCSAEEKELTETLMKTMQFYCRRDLDKSLAEDKHLFRPDELMTTAGRAGMELKHFPNWRITESEQANLTNRPGYFHRFFNSYIRYCMDWPQEFAIRAGAAMQPYFRFFTPMEQPDMTVPQCFGSFLFTKR
jgi:ubiquinone/menaquinone biosynthesis C-methylase UbiE